MFKLTTRGLWAHKRRLTGTFLAIFLGVAFLAGTQVLGDTMRASFDTLFTDANRGTDVVVRNATDVSNDAAAQRGSIDASVASRVSTVDGVAAAEPVVRGVAQMVDKSGKSIDGNGPRFAASWIRDSQLNPWHVVDGRAPRASHEVVVDRHSANQGHLHVGDTTTLLTPDRVNVRVVGIAKFGSADAIGGSSYTGMTLGDAQHYLTGGSGRISQVLVRGDSGVAQDALVARIAPVLPSGAEAISGTNLTGEQTRAIDKEFLGTFRIFLTVFAGIALLVAVFSIHNTFAILVAQRTRASALLRAVGASRRQVLGGVILEALAIGVVASIAGLAGGVGVAVLLKAMFSAFGLGLPATGIAFNASTVAIALPVGIGVTLIAAIAPALKAGRVAPLAALREVAADRSAASRRRTILGTGLTVVGTALVIAAATGGAIANAGFGGLAVLAGIVALGPALAGPASRVLGWPLPRLRGVTGSLARRNAARSPRRTAGAASALMVGVAVVTLFTVFAASLKASINETVAKEFTGDLVVESGGFNSTGMSPKLTHAIAGVPQVQSAVGLGAGSISIDGTNQQINVVDPGKVGSVLDLGVKSGSLPRLGSHQIAVSKKKADDKGWRVGSKVAVRFPDGAREQVTVGAIYKERNIAGDYIVSRAAWAPHTEQLLESAVLVKLRPGADAGAAKASVEGIATGFGKPKVEDRGQFVASRAQNVNTMLGLVYVMLALAIAIALMGIANTLSLAVAERTRELGVLRAVGATRAQIRKLVRYESVIVAAIGAIGGIALGGLLGWAVVESTIQAGDLTAFDAPAGQLLAILIVGALAGVLAAIRPARRAAKLDVLRAVTVE